VVVVLALALALGLTPRASADCAREASELREHLTREASRTQTWNTAWAVAFAAAAFGQLALVALERDPLGTYDRAFEEQMLVGAGKASLGAAVRIIRPLTFAIPEATDEPCADVRALRATVARVGRRERNSVLLTVIGGTAVNLLGAWLLWERNDFGTAAQSFATGAVVGPISAYTQPRASWRLWQRRRVDWDLGIGAGSVWLSGAF
jgi:hypothetical protein